MQRGCPTPDRRGTGAPAQRNPNLGRRGGWPRTRCVPPRARSVLPAPLAPRPRPPLRQRHGRGGGKGGDLRPPGPHAALTVRLRDAAARRPKAPWRRAGAARKDRGSQTHRFTARSERKLGGPTSGPSRAWGPTRSGSALWPGGGGGGGASGTRRPGPAQPASAR